MFCPNADCPHAQSTGEPAEYQRGVTQCRECGAPLVATKPTRLCDEPAEAEEFVPVLAISNAAVVSFVRSLLESTGMRFFIKNEGVQDLFGLGRFGAGFNPLTGPPVVFVEPARAEEARELLAQLEEGEDE
jgi:hypothetical protein